MTGRGIERVALRRCWVEEGTGGLWYASVDASVELRRDSSRGRTGGSASTAAAAAAAAAATSSGSRAASRAAYTSDDGPAPSERAATIRRLERAISQGAPAYNRGDVRESSTSLLKQVEGFTHFTFSKLTLLINVRSSCEVHVLRLPNRPSAECGRRRRKGPCFHPSRLVSSFFGIPSGPNPSNQNTGWLI